MDSRLLIERRENSEGRRDKRTNQREVKLELSGSRSAINCALCFLYFFFFLCRIIFSEKDCLEFPTRSSHSLFFRPVLGSDLRGARHRPVGHLSWRQRSAIGANFRLL